MQTSKYARKKKLTSLQIASSENQIILFEGKKRGHAHCNSSFARKKKLTNLQMATSLFMMGHSMNKIFHHGLYHSVGPNGNCIIEPIFRFS
jgi:uncharacterized protein (UPF0303 family)